MFACAALAGCTNNDIVENDVSNVINGERETSIAVRLAFPQDGISRAAAVHESFDNGEAFEYNVENVYFAFYSAGGKFLGFDEKAKTDFTWTTNPNGNNVTSKSAVTLKSEEEPASVVAIVNCPAKLKGKSLNELETALAMSKEDYGKCSTTTGDVKKGEFIMLNSTYMDENNNIVKATPIPTDYMFNSEAEAEAASNTKILDIYVERLAAKVSVTEANNMVTPTLANIEGLEGYTFEITGWGLNGTNKTVYPLKQLSTSYSAFVDKVVWNSSSKHRSYWAEDPNYSNGTYISDADITKPEEDGGNYEAPANASLNFYSWNETDKESGEYDYCLENTMTESLLGNGKAIAYTHLLVAAQVKKETTVANLYEYKKKFFDEGGLKNLILNTIKNKYGYKKAVTKNEITQYDDLVQADMEITNVKEVARITVLETVTLKKLKADANAEGWSDATNVIDVTTEDKAAMEAYYGTATFYNGGRCYYYIPIKHFKDLQEFASDNKVTNMFKFGAIGVVRNHWYNLNITKIMNIGEPVYDPDAPIVPKDEEEKEWFLQARLNILAWNKMPQQDVEF